MVIKHYRLPDLIVTDKSSLFTSKFLLSFCYFLRIKQKLSTTFHHQINGHIKRQNNSLKAYLQAFVNFN